MSSQERPAQDEPDIKNAKLKEDEEITGANYAFRFDDSDITVISSEGLKFKVHKWALQRSSRVFRDMVDIGDREGDNQQIELTDREIDKSETLQLFFTLIYMPLKLELPEIIDDEILGSVEPFIPLTEFFQKYDITYPRDVFKLSVLAWIGSPHPDIRYAFTIGALLDDPKICSAAIKCRKDNQWHPESHGGSRAGKHVLDLTAAYSSWWVEIPDKYRWALIKASSKISGKNRNIWDQMNALKQTGKWYETKDKIAETFEDYLNEYCWN